MLSWPSERPMSTDCHGTKVSWTLSESLNEADILQTHDNVEADGF